MTGAIAVVPETGSRATVRGVRAGARTFPTVKRQLVALCLRSLSTMAFAHAVIARTFSIRNLITRGLRLDHMRDTAPFARLILPAVMRSAPTRWCHAKLASR